MFALLPRDVDDIGGVGRVGTGYTPSPSLPIREGKTSRKHVTADQRGGCAEVGHLIGRSNISSRSTGVRVRASGREGVRAAHHTRNPLEQGDQTSGTPRPTST